MKIYINEDKLVLIKENEEENVTFYKFFTEVKNFIQDLLDDPINAKPSEFFKNHDISKSLLLNKMIDRDIVTKHENIDEPYDADGNKKSMHSIQYRVPKKNFEQKIKRLYSYFFENEKRKKKINESVGGNYFNSVATYIFCYDKDGNKCVLAGRRLHFGSVGLYNVPTGLVGDEYEGEEIDDAAIREVYEEAGLSISKEELEDAGETRYTDRWGEEIGKNFAVYLEGTTDEYPPGEGDGENEQFVWIPEAAIDCVRWAFEMDKMVKKLINYL